MTFCHRHFRLSSLIELAEVEEGKAYAFLSGRCGEQTEGVIPRHNRSRRSGEGKSRPNTLPTHRGSRSKVIRCGRPEVCKKLITASIAVCSWKSSLACANNAVEVPASTRIAYLDHMLALALRALFSRHTPYIFAHPFESPPTAPEAKFARVSSVAWTEYNLFSEAASRPFG